MYNDYFRKLANRHIAKALDDMNKVQKIEDLAVRALMREMHRLSEDIQYEYNKDNNKDYNNERDTDQENPR